MNAAYLCTAYRRVCRALPALAATMASMTAGAHSASDAYLTLTGPTLNGPTPTGLRAATAAPGDQTVLHAQWDIALRDLDFVLQLDDNGDGDIVWGELRRHQTDIARYAYPHLHWRGDGRSCRMAPTGQMVDDHADGAYASLMFDVICPGKPARLRLDYQLFFAIDPSHRAIVVFRSADNVATSVLSPDKARIDLPL